MRTFAVTISALVMMTVRTQALDWDTLSINENPVPAEATVSFSIGYPKGWRVSQDYNQQRRDIYFDIPTPHNFGPICWFIQPASAKPLLQQDLTEYAIWPSDSATAKEAAQKFFADQRTSTACAPKNLRPVKTSAGDSGWLVESEGTLRLSPIVITNTSQIMSFMKSKLPGEDVPITNHDFFFHHGNKGAIRIQIWTRTADSTRRSELDQLVLQTLRFN